MIYGQCKQVQYCETGKMTNSCRQGPDMDVVVQIKEIKLSLEDQWQVPERDTEKEWSVLGIEKHAHGSREE